MYCFFNIGTLVLIFKHRLEYYLRKAHGIKTLVLLQRARRARYTSPLGQVVEFGRWSNTVLWVKFPIGGMRCLSLFVRCSFVR